VGKQNCHLVRVWADGHGLTLLLSYRGHAAECCWRHRHLPL